MLKNYEVKTDVASVEVLDYCLYKNKEIRVTRPHTYHIVLAKNTIEALKKLKSRFPNAYVYYVKEVRL